MKNDDVELLREYLRESILLEYIDTDPRYAAASLRKAVGGATKELEKGVEAGVGDVKKLGATLSRGVKTIAGNLLQAVTLGLYKHDQDTINDTYERSIQDIERKYGGAKKALNAAFGESISTLQKVAFLYSPGTTLASVLVGKGLEQMASSIEKMQMKSGASKQYKKKIDAYYDKIQNDAKLTAAQQKKTQDEPTSRLSSEKKGAVTSPNDLKKIKERLKSELEEMKKLNLQNTPLFKKHNETLDILGNIN